MPGPRFAASKFRGPPAAEWSLCAGGADRAFGWAPHIRGVLSGGEWSDPSRYEGTNTINSGGRLQAAHAIKRILIVISTC